MLVCGCVRESSHRQPSLSSRPPPLLDPHSPQATGGTGGGQLNAEHEPNVGIGSPNAGAIACPMWRLSTRRQRDLERFTPANEVPPRLPWRGRSIAGSIAIPVEAASKSTVSALSGSPGSLRSLSTSVSSGAVSSGARKARTFAAAISLATWSQAKCRALGAAARPAP